MSAFRLQLIPSHNETAGRNLPLTLGRTELAKWWWRACPCARTIATTRTPCPHCQLLAKSVKSLSKKMLCITGYGRLSVVSRKNRNILWYNGKPMVKSSDSTAILLQPGDSISIGRSPETPWMEFYVTRVPIAVTPDTDTKNANPLAVTTPPAKSKRRRLYYTSSESSNAEQLVFSEAQHDIVFTQTMSKRDGSFDRQQSESFHQESPCKKRPTRKRKSTTMSPRKLLDTQNDYRANVKDYTESVNKKTRTEPSLDSSSEESRFSISSDSFPTRRQRTAAGSGKQVEAHVNVASMNASARKTSNRVRKETLRRTVPSTAESMESSVLSLPQCPTWDDDEEESKCTLQNDNVRHDKYTCESQGMNQRARGSQASFHSQIDRNEDSPVITFASALTLSQWKEMKQVDSQNDGSRVRRALASLVVAQRARDSTWLPSILEGTVIAYC